MEQKAELEVRVLVALAILALCLMAAVVVVGDELRYVPGWGYTDEPYVPGDGAGPSPGHYEQLDDQALVDEVQESLGRIEQMQREIKSMERQQLWGEIQRRR